MHNLGEAFGHIKYTLNNIKVKSALKDCIADLHASCMLGGGMVLKWRSDRSYVQKTRCTMSWPSSIVESVHVWAHSLLGIIFHQYKYNNIIVEDRQL